MDNNVIVVSHVATEVDADCAVAVLADSGINAAKQYRNAPGGSTLFALPGAMGFGASEGYDILVAAEAEGKAREILIGAGYAEPAEEEQNEDAQVSDAEEPAAEEALSEEKPAEQEAPARGSALLMILFLVAAALFVIGVDRLIEIIKSLF